MSTGNASGFLLFGLAMWVSPTVAPDLFPKNGLDGSSARAMWIQLMAVVQVTVGLGFLLQLELWPRLLRWLTSEPAAQPVWGRDPVSANAVPVEGVSFARGRSEQGALLAARGLQSNGLVAFRGMHAALWRALKVAFLDEERFMNFLERLRLLA